MGTSTIIGVCRRHWLLTIVLALAVGTLSWAILSVAPIVRYNNMSSRIRDKVYDLRKRKPDGISEHLWDECTAWAGTAQGNICFSEGHARYAWMSRFEEQLDERLKEEVNLSTIEWIGRRLAESGPYGEEYFANMQWWQRWEDLVEAIETGSRR